jgi:hypothetical protein
MMALCSLCLPHIMKALEYIKINLKSSHIHLASRGLKDSIGDVEYCQGKMRIGLRANGIPVNIFVDLI